MDHHRHRGRGAARTAISSTPSGPSPTAASSAPARVDYIAAYAPDKLKKAAKDVRIAIIYEDGPYGAGVAAANESEGKKLGMQIVLKEGYSAQAADLSSLVTKLRASRPDVLFHTGYNPDINLFLRQAKEQGLRVKAYIGHGAGPQPARQAEGGVRQRGGGLPHRGPARLAAHRRQEAEAGRGRPDPGDGEALQGLRAQRPGQQHRAARLDGLQQHVDPAQRRAAARHPEARRLRPRTRSPRPRARPTFPRAAPCRATG